jgi:hypothetical protein
MPTLQPKDTDRHGVAKYRSEGGRSDMKNSPDILPDHRLSSLPSAPQARNLYRIKPKRILSSVRSGIFGSWQTRTGKRAKVSGHPERFAQETLGHNSEAVHQAYAKRALMKIPSLEQYEERATPKGISTV